MAATDTHLCAASTTVACVVELRGAGFAATDRIALVDVAGTCGTSAVVTGVFAADQSTYEAASTSTVALHSLGLKQAATAGAYRICLCATGAACATGTAANWATDAGRLGITTVSTSVVSAYAGLTFDLTVTCGAACSGGRAARVKVVEDSATNDATPPGAGCRSAMQAARYVLPPNCYTATQCAFAPSSGGTTAPTWAGLLMGVRWSNLQQVSTTYDVCFCDQSCDSPYSWAKAGEIVVKAVAVQGPGYANEAGDVWLLGSQTTWGSSEGKLVADIGGSLSSDDCFDIEQSTALVEGHSCTSKVDCTAPTVSPNGRSYSGVTLRSPGWIAVCYCDSSCQARRHWFSMGRFLVAGTVGGQFWTTYRAIRSSLEVSGWGLSSANRIRIIAADKDCATTSEQDVNLVTGPDPAVASAPSGAAGSITALAAEASAPAASTRVTFGAAHGLAAGARVALSGVVCTSSCTQEDIDALNTDHIVQAVPSTTEITIAVGFLSGAYPVMSVAAATWARTDAQTYASVLATSVGRYHVCWRPAAASEPAKSTSAGTLLVTEPSSMSASLFLTTIEPGRTAPVVVAFTTAANRRYNEALEAMQLKLSFPQAALLAVAKRDGSPLAADAARDTLAEAAQSTCGDVILELHSADAAGFPMPAGCYFNEAGGVWDFYLVFSKQAGLRPATTYEVVLNAKVQAGLATTQDLVEVWSMDDVVNKVGDVLEVGRAKANRAVATVLRGASDPAFDGTAGMEVVGGTDPSVLTLSGLSSVRMTLKAGSATPITAGTTIILFLQPLLQWSLGGACAATCIPQTGKVCGTVYCDVSSVMGDIWRRNVMTLSLPQTMDQITDAVKHDLEYTSVALPPGGFFPTRFAAELQVKPGERPHYAVTSGKLLYVEPKLSASLIDVLGDGNSKPFRGDAGNDLYARLVLGADIYAAAATDAVLTISAPAAYACVGVADAPSTLSIFAGAAPTGRGELARGGSEGTWSSASNVCFYSFAASQAVFAGCSFFLQLSVNNPSAPLPQSAAGNEWKAKIAAKGLHTAILSSQDIAFSASSSGREAASMSVQGLISDFVIVPSDFAQGSTKNWLSIFFRVEQAVPTGGAVTLRAPRSFDFGEKCELARLPSYQYSDYPAAAMDVSTADWLRLPLSFREGACRGRRSTPQAPSFDLAGIALSGPLDAGGRYGFRLRVASARHYFPQQRDGWRISTELAGGVPLDGSLHSARLNAEEADGASKSWVTYDFSVGPPLFGVAISAMLPAPGVHVEVSPIVLRVATSGPLRVLAPAGYVWDFVAADFLYQSAAPGRAANTVVPGAAVDLPIAAAPAKPAASPFNVLEVAGASVAFRAGVRYGFITKITVPGLTPVASANVFVLLVGDDTAVGGRVQAGVVEAPRVRRIFGASAWLASAVKGQSSALSLRFETVTRVPAAGGLVVTGPSGYAAGGAPCTLEGAAGTAPSCTCTLQESGGNTVISAEVAGAMEPGVWLLRVPVVNPSAATAAAATPVGWSIVSQAPMTGTPVTLDAALTALGVRIGEPMAAAGIVTGQLCLAQAVSSCAVEDRQYQRTGRNDRPGEANSLVFSLTPSSGGLVGRVAVRAPLGFEWVPECNVTIDAAKVFGVDSALPAGFAQWPAGITAAGCRGQGPVMYFTVSSNGATLPAAKLAFRVNSVRNPPQQPADNKWAIEFGTEASAPFDGFPLWLLGDAALQAEDVAAGAANTVALRFKPLHAVPAAEGALVVTAPRGFSAADCAGAEILEAAACDAPFPNCYAAAGGEADPALQRGTAKLRCEASGNVAVIRLLAAPLAAGTQYVLRLPMRNPAAPTSAAGTWRLGSRRYLPWIGDGSSSFEAWDVAEIGGFLVVPRVQVFVMDSPVVPNGLAAVAWEFVARFAEAVYAKETVVFEAPRGYSIEGAAGGGACNNLASLSPSIVFGAAACGSSACYYTATCAGARMTWALERCPGYVAPAPSAFASVVGLCLEPGALLGFGLGSRNPELTPSWNRFSMRHVSLDGRTVSSSTLESYRIYPLLRSFAAELNMTNAGGKLFEAVGSESAVRLRFVTAATVGSEYLVIRGAVGGQSFKLNGATAYDDSTGQALPIQVRQADRIVLRRKMELPGEQISITLKPLQNPAIQGVSHWNLSTYKFWNQVQGLRVVVNEILDAPGFRVLGYVAAQGVGSSTTLKELVAPCGVLPCPAYFGRAALLSLAFRSSVATPAGGVLLVRAPPGYAFQREEPDEADSAKIRVRLSGAVLTKTFVISGGGLFTGRWEEFDASAAFAADVPVYKQAGAPRYLFWRPAAREWAITFVPGEAPTGRVGEARVAVPPNSVEVAAAGVPAVPHRGWSVGSSAGWAPAPFLGVYGEGRLANSDPARLSLTLGTPLAASVLSAVEVPMALPTLDEVAATASAGAHAVERKWLLETSDSSGTRLATNDELFLGFALADQLAFSITPSHVAPSVSTDVAFAFRQLAALAGVGAPEPTTVRYDLRAPAGFVFPLDCFSAAERAKTARLFDACSGLTRTASLTSGAPGRIKGGIEDLIVGLTVVLPRLTPTANYWTLEHFLQNSAQRSGYGEITGFEVRPMRVAFAGSSTLGSHGVGYFTFSPSSNVSAGSTIRFEVPSDQGYEISCVGIVLGTLPAATKCTGTVVDDLVTLLVPAGVTLEQGVEQTVGLRIWNPNKLVLSHVNMWKATIKTAKGEPRDTNFDIPGTDLATSYLSVATALDVLAFSAGSVSVAFPIVASRALQAGLVSELQVEAPSGVRIASATAAKALSPNVTSIAGVRLVSVKLSADAGIPQGRHVLRVMGSASAEAVAQGYGGGLWVFRALRPDGLYYQVAVSGFSS